MRRKMAMEKQNRYIINTKIKVLKWTIKCQKVGEKTST